MTTLPPAQLLLAHIPHIERVAAHACRRRGFTREETQDFVSHVNFKILQEDYAVIRKHKGKSTLMTYLTMVIQNLFRDHLNHIWGKWRPCAEAERLGPLAVQLDKMLSRDRLPLAEACEILLRNHHVEATRQELEDLAAKFPYRTLPLPPKGEEELENRPSPELPPDERVVAQEAAARRREILGFLQEGLALLPPQDALLAKMSCELKVSDIARTLRLEQKPLYRRLEKILKTLREYLESRGVRPGEIGGLLSIPEDDHEPRE